MLATCGLTFSENWMTTRGGGAWTNSRGDGSALTGRAWAAALGTRAKSETASPTTSESASSASRSVCERQPRFLATLRWSAGAVCSLIREFLDSWLAAATGLADVALDGSGDNTY